MNTFPTLSDKNIITSVKSTFELTVDFGGSVESASLITVFSLVSTLTTGLGSFSNFSFSFVGIG